MVDRIQQHHSTSYSAPFVPVISSKPFSLSEALQYIKPASQLAAEVEQGNHEYKFKLSNMTEAQVNHRISQLQWRLNEGGGNEAVYHIGVEDDGHPLGLTEAEMQESLLTLQYMAEKADCEMIVKQLFAGEQGITAEVLMRRKERFITLDAHQLSIALAGDVDSGKSTLIGVLCSGKTDNGKGLARTRVFTHNHEVLSGRTSCISHNLIHFGKNGEILNVDSFPGSNNPGLFNSHRLRALSDLEVAELTHRTVTLMDVAGHVKYLKTTLHGMVGQKPDYIVVCVSAVHGVTRMTMEHISLAVYLNVPLLVFVTKVDLVTSKVQKQQLQRGLLTNTQLVQSIPALTKVYQDLQSQLTIIGGTLSVISSGAELMNYLAPADQVSTHTGSNPATSTPTIPSVNGPDNHTSEKKIIPIVLLSSVSGEGLSLVKSVFFQLPTPKKALRILPLPLANSPFPMKPLSYQIMNNAHHQNSFLIRNNDTEKEKSDSKSCAGVVDARDEVDSGAPAATSTVFISSSNSNTSFDSNVDVSNNNNSVNRKRLNYIRILGAFTVTSDEEKKKADEFDDLNEEEGDEGDDDADLDWGDDDVTDDMDATADKKVKKVKPKYEFDSSKYGLDSCDLTATSAVTSSFGLPNTKKGTTSAEKSKPYSSYAQYLQTEKGQKQQTEQLKQLSLTRPPLSPTVTVNPACAFPIVQNSPPAAPSSNKEVVQQLKEAKESTTDTVVSNIEISPAEMKYQRLLAELSLFIEISSPNSNGNNHVSTNPSVAATASTNSTFAQQAVSAMASASNTASPIIKNTSGKKVLIGKVMQGRLTVGDVLVLGPSTQGVFLPVLVSSLRLNNVPVRYAKVGQTATFQLTRLPAAHSLLVQQPSTMNSNNSNDNLSTGITQNRESPPFIACTSINSNAINSSSNGGRRRNEAGGLVLLPVGMKPLAAWEFTAEISLLITDTLSSSNTTNSTASNVNNTNSKRKIGIKLGYEAVVHLGAVRQTVKVVDIVRLSQSNATTNNALVVTDTDTDHNSSTTVNKHFDSSDTNSSSSTIWERESDEAKKQQLQYDAVHSSNMMGVHSHSAPVQMWRESSTGSDAGLAAPNNNTNNSTATNNSNGDNITNETSTADNSSSINLDPIAVNVHYPFSSDTHHANVVSYDDTTIATTSSYDSGKSNRYVASDATPRQVLPILVTTTSNKDTVLGNSHNSNSTVNSNVSEESGAKREEIEAAGVVREEQELFEGERAVVRFRFVYYPEFVCVGEAMILREHRIRALGTVLDTQLFLNEPF